ncbi:MAG: peptide chain release factor N(5)-glutamine methyltransferase [Armatimonadetes bacterium]|nr:peptide chain release factor N(5)-glutamine methyltransferase [Armatimonadota bacterium]
MTLSQQIDRAAQALAESGIESARLDAQVLAAHALGQDRSYVLAHGADELDLPHFDQLVDRRAEREPLAYILGWREFYGRRFVVTPEVLVPRQETETLIDHVLAPAAALTILDVGTGSGCIAVTLALEMPKAKVTAVDVSEPALKVARSNAETLGAGVEFLQSDLLVGVPDREFDLVVSNPPYVASDDELMPEVRGHEPHIALFAGVDGLDVYRRLASEAPRAMKPGGRLVIELGDGAADAVQDVFLAAGWLPPTFANDLSGVRRVAAMKRP